MATVMGTRQAGLLNDPRWLGAAAGGLLAATAVLWAMRGLPFGLFSFWVAPLPLFAAGLAAGPGAALGAPILGALLVWLVAGEFASIVFLGAFGVPAAAMTVLAFRGGALDAGRAVIVLGLWPAAVILMAAVAAAGQPGGLEGVLRKITEQALARAGFTASDIAMADIVRIKAAAIGFWFAMLLSVNGTAAQRLVARRGLALAPTPRWSEMRLPRFYAAVPLVAAGGWMLAPAGADTIPLSVLLVTLLPVFLAGLAAVHRYSRGKAARTPMLIAFYLGLVLLVVPAMAAVTAFGFWDQWGRRGASSGGTT